VDAIFVSSSSKDEKTFQAIANKDVPLIFFDRKKSMPNVSSVTIDDFKAGYKATMHLLEQGYQKIAHISGDLNIEIFKKRFAGYKKALEEFGLEVNDQYHFTLKSSVEDGQRAVKKLLKLPEPPDAIFSSSDFAALGAIQELKAQKVAIPNDFGIVGFSNEPFTKFMELTISTIDQSPLLMGINAAKVFLELISQKEKEKVKIEKKVVLEPELIVRNSSKRK
jgi:LacI family transcriptional regulator